jgi:MYXO-CTERM domain-containing protein
VSRRTAALALIALLPLTLAAADPRGDAVRCKGVAGAGDPPDLVRALGWLGEEGSSAVWRLSFARPLAVPDPRGPAVRVDILVRDPTIPALSFDDYRHVNRIVRFDATSRNASIWILFLPEGGSAPFNPPMVQGRTITIQVPGRLLLGEDQFGDVDLMRLRWSVVVRDGGRCDLLGNGIPSYRMATVAPPTSSPTASAVPSTTPGPSASSTPVVGVAAIAVAGLAVLTLFALRRRR